jgi:hypothetical protein
MTKSSEAKGYETMRLSVAAATLNWGDLENSIVRFFRDLIQSEDLSLAPIIYFAPSNTETRLYIVDAVAHHILSGGYRFIKFGEEALTCWTAILSKINKAKEGRNKIAHGQILEIPGRKTHFRLTSSIYDIGRFTKEPLHPQLPGLSQHDVQEIADKFHELHNLVDELTNVIRALRDPDDQASPEKLRSLAIRLKTSIPSLDVHFPKEQQCPHEPS